MVLRFTLTLLTGLGAGITGTILTRRYWRHILTIWFARGDS